MKRLIGLTYYYEIMNRQQKLVAAAAAAAASVGIVVAGTLIMQYCLSKEIPKDENFEKVELQDSESTSMMLMLLSVSTVTFYDGNLEDVKSYLLEKLTKIVQLNPWLQGRLERGNNKKLYLKYSSLSLETLKPETFQCIEDTLLNESMNYEALTERLSPYVVKEGERVVGKDEPLFRVTVIRISSSKFALLCSLSHVIADGYTYYTLYSMLCTTITPRALIVERKQDFTQRLESTMKGNDTYHWCFSLGTTINILKTLLFAKKPEVFITSIATEKIAIEKEKYISTFLQSTSPPPPTPPPVDNTKNISHHVTPVYPAFISTNDILTSWFFKLYQCDVGIMSMNFRNRFADLTDDHAGNYQVLLGYQPNDVTYPYLIRQSLSMYHRVHKEIALPSFWYAMNSNVATLTNWATFYHEIKLPSCTHLSHFPYLLNRKIAFTNFSVIFCPRANELQLLSFTRRFNSDSKNSLSF
jgi:hypothetical protein